MGEKTADQQLLEENQRLRGQIRFYQEYDRLTGLYNKQTFYQKTETLLLQYPDEPFDIVGIDVERFKVINDLYGTEQGDDLLQYLSCELSAAFSSEKSLLSRLSDDVFIMCICRPSEQEIERRILEIFQDYPLNTTIIPAIGFYQVSDRSVRISLMCDWAIIALNSIKGNYLKHSEIFDSRLRSALLEEQEILNDMNSALVNREFEIFMQPKCNMYTEKVIGAEALVRWRHPTKGLIPPNSFIPIFERNGFIKKLDAYVWEATAAWLRGWIDAGNLPVPISVNISRIDVYGMDVCGILRDLLKKYQLDTSLLELEITESAYVDQTEQIIKMTKNLMGHGFTILMDDFGSGYSSLNMLNDISVDILKIDMKFLERDDQKSKDILDSVVHMGKWLNLPVIAEGVESKNQVDFLLEIGCMYAQGFFYYKPMPLKDFEALLLNYKKVDYVSHGKLKIEREMLLDFHDLFHKDFMSDKLLGNILGAIALYAYDGSHLYILRGTEEYYRLTERSIQPQDAEEDLLPVLLEEDCVLLLHTLEQMKVLNDEHGVKISVRRKLSDQLHWFQLRLFHLSKKNEKDIFYASLSDITDQMKAIETLRISEERFRLAMEATNIVIFELDINTREARYSEYAQKAFALNSTVADAPESFIEQGMICPEDEDRFRGIYEAIYRGEEKASAVIQMTMSDGRIVQNRITLTAVKDDHGKTVKAVGMVEDVSHENN